MKKTMTAMLSLALVGAIAIPGFAADAESPNLIAEPPALITEAPSNGASTYIIQVNGKDTGINTCVMVPLRAVAEKLGYKVTWDNGSVLVDSGVMHTNVTIGVDSYLLVTSVEGVIGTSAPFSLGTAPLVTNGVTYVPLSLFDALLGRDGAITVDGNKIMIRTEGKENVQIPNPFEDCATMADAEKLAGFTVTIPEKMPEGYVQKSIQVMDHRMIQVSYENGDQELLIRKAKGNEDISGDYNEYAEKNTLAVGSLQVSVRGANGKVNVATWVDGAFTYSVSAGSDGAGLAPAVISDMVSGIR